MMNCYESNCAFSNNTSGSLCKNCNITINCDEKSNCAGMPTCRLGTFYDNTATSCLVESDKTYGNSTVNRTLHNTNCTNCITYLNDQEMHEYVMNNVNCTNCLSETIAKKGLIFGMNNTNCNNCTSKFIGDEIGFRGMMFSNCVNCESQ